MKTVDLLAFGAYLAVVLWLGWCFRRRARTPSEFYVAGRSMRWLPVGLSVMVTAFSAVNYVAFPAEVFAHGLYVLASLPVFVLVAVPVTRVIMPFFHGMRLTSAYRYLEHRFDVRVRRMAALFFVLWRLLWMAVALYACGRILAAVVGGPPAVFIVVAGIVAVVYTTLGGMRAVMWTDVLQFCVLLAGIAAALAVGVSRVPDGILGLWRTARSDMLLRPFQPWDPAFVAWDPTMRISLWSGLAGTLVAFLARYGADQMVLQRYFSARSLKDARMGFWLNVAASLTALLLLAGLGLALRAAAPAAGEGGLPGGATAALTAFVRSLPAGVSGLVAAGLLAATMSSVDSGLNACAAACDSDLAPWLVRGAAVSERQTFGRAGTVLLGGVVIGLALSVGRLGSLFALVNRVINGMGSPLLAVMLLALFSRRVTANGVLWGGLVGFAASAWVCFTVDSLALHHYAVVNLGMTLLACYAATLCARRAAAPTPAQLAWTWWQRRR